MSIIIDFYHHHKRSSVSIDPVIFELYSIHCGNPTIAKECIRHFCSLLLSLGEKNLSRQARHFVLSYIVRPELAKKFFNSDGTLQIELDV
jgi:hypothetical protein